MAVNTLEWTQRSIGMGYPGGGGVTIPGAVQGMTGHDTQYQALVDKVGVDDLEAFSNLNYAMILSYEKVAPVSFKGLSGEDTLRERIPMKPKLFDVFERALTTGSHKSKTTV